LVFPFPFLLELFFLLALAFKLLTSFFGAIIYFQWNSSREVSRDYTPFCLQWQRWAARCILLAMFALTEALMTDIAFAMEDQTEDALIDLESGRIAYPGLDNDFPEDADQVEDFSNTERWASLPTWSSAQGFRLMERFADGLADPVARKRLTRSLTQRKGVFRSFKEALQEFPELETIFFRFKDGEMRRHIRLWYAQLRLEGDETAEGAGPSPSGIEDAEFRVSEISADQASAVLTRFFGNRDLGQPPLVLENQSGAARDLILAKLNHELANGAGCLTVSLPVEGDMVETCAGFALFTPFRDPGGCSAVVSFIESLPEYRGVGIEELLIGALRNRGFSPILIQRYSYFSLVERDPT
jgi:hypothetical protein